MPSVNYQHCFIYLFIYLCIYVFIYLFCCNVRYCKLHSYLGKEMLLSLAAFALILGYAGGDEKCCLPYSNNDIITSLLIVCGGYSNQI